MTQLLCRLDFRYERHLLRPLPSPSMGGSPLCVFRFTIALGLRHLVILDCRSGAFGRSSAHTPCRGTLCWGGVLWPTSGAIWCVFALLVAYLVNVPTHCMFYSGRGSFDVSNSSAIEERVFNFVSWSLTLTAGMGVLFYLAWTSAKRIREMNEEGPVATK